ncbi:hypothetical protein [Streptomyces sp. YIM 98790]|uniref:hypothetical protein n=1 Tax=Streptomyces sp. YIM 98790 TaxID=2689077 RepID=UPI00140B7B94|nr:hypothetical protein [Streptomyces sp. YIM 98790]
MTQLATLFTEIPDLAPSPAAAWWLLIPVAALALGRLVFLTVRWFRADSETRVSLRQAHRIRRTWRRLAPMTGLAITDPTPTTTDQLRSNGHLVEPKVKLPRIKTTVDQFGVTVTANTLLRVGLQAWQDAADDLCNGWGMQRSRSASPGPASSPPAASATNPSTLHFPHRSFRLTGHQP